MPTWITPVSNLLAVLLSAYLSYRVSKLTLHAELKKLDAVWKHERQAQDDADFAEMVAAVSVYLSHPTYEFLERSARAVGVYRAKSPADISASVDELGGSLSTRDSAAISAALSRLLEHRRISHR
nr:MAG TPA: hypothetical protein [Caudoviricetes sp.]